MQLTKKGGLFSSSRIVFLPTDSIGLNPSQPRRNFDPDALKELSESISRYGVLQPLTVRKLDRRFELVAGERRLRAARLAGLHDVPCIVLGVDSEESSLIALVENLHRRDLDFVEEAEGLKNLISRHGMSQEEAARRVGRSQSAVANKLRILRLHPAILSAIRKSGLTERHARALLRLENEDEQREALAHIVKKGLSVARTEEYIDFFITHKKQPPERRTGKSVIMVKDVRFFLNTITHGVDVMRKSGVPAQCGQDETDTDIILTIKIPKSKAQGA